MGGVELSRPRGLAAARSTAKGTRVRGFRAALLISLIGILATALTAGSMGRAHRTKLDERIAAEVEARSDRVTEGLQQAEKSLEFLASLLLIKPSLSSTDFADVASEILMREPAISGLSWNPRVRPPERAAFVAEAQITRPDFQIRTVEQLMLPTRPVEPPPAEADAYVVRFIEPIERHGRALGLDVSSESGRRIALESAIAFALNDKPTNMDVVFGRGNAHHQTSGNKSYFALVKHLQPRYKVKGQKKEVKRSIIQDVIDTIRNRRGHFLMFDKKFGARFSRKAL